MYRAVLSLGIRAASVCALLMASPVLAQGVDSAEQGVEQDDAQARVLYENGALLYEEGRYEEAILAWEEAYRLSGRPLLLYNLANAQERVGDWASAVDSLNGYRAFAPAEERETLERRIQNLEARVKLNQALLEPEVVGGPSAPGETAPTTMQSQALPNRAQKSSPSLSVAPLTTSVLTGVFAVSGTYFGLQNRRSLALATNGCMESSGLYICTDEAAAWINKAHTQAVVADVSFVLTGIGAVASGLLHLRAHQQTQSHYLVPEVAPERVGLLWHGEF